MKLETIKQGIWTGIYVILLGLIVANFWLAYSLDMFYPFPFPRPLTFAIAPICGGFVYLFIHSIKKAFYTTIILCFVSCCITGLYLYLPAYFGILDPQISGQMALRVPAIMFIYIFPFAIGGCFVAAYISPG
ncbi:MAG: hypothetical protein HXS53_07340 [Theionarchaea archaeon]|nr:hypothetical protein [Theionarchaea archaeon]